MKSVLIDEEAHKKLKEASKKTGIKIKVLVETGIKYYLQHLQVTNNSKKSIWDELSE